MRIKFEFICENDLDLPIQYNQIVQGFIYSNIKDKKFSQFLHDKGFRYENRTFKLFTYSRIMGKFRIENGRIYIKSPFDLVVASPIEKFINDFTENIFRQNELRLGSNIIKIKKIDLYTNNEIKDNIKIKMISPVVLYSTVDLGDKKFTQYYSPWDNNFSYLITRNIEKKYTLINGYPPCDMDLEILPIGKRDEKYKRVMKFKDTVINGWMGIYIMKGNIDFIKIAYETGLGSKNSEGFGCFDIVNQ